MKKFSLASLSCTLLALINPVFGQDAKTTTAVKPAATTVAQKKAQTPVAYVRLEKIMAQEENLDGAAHEWRDRVKDLTKDLEPRIQDLMAEREKLEKDAAELNNPENSKWMAAQAKDAKRQELAQRAAMWEAKGQQLDNERRQRAASLQLDLFNKVQKAAEELAEERGYDVVLYAGAAYASKRSDITQDVLNALNAIYAKEQAAKEAAAKKEKAASAKKAESGTAAKPAAAKAA